MDSLSSLFCSASHLKFCSVLAAIVFISWPQFWPRKHIHEQGLKYISIIGTAVLNGTHRLTEGTAVSAVDMTVVVITAALSGTPLTGVTFHLIAATGLHLNAEGPMVVH